MKLFSAPISPFAARVRIALAAKDLGCEVGGPPAAGLKSADYLALNPMGKLPLLVLDDGTPLPESETILEYLEDAYPERPLRPVDPVRRASMRTLMRIVDNYVTPPTVRLFPHLDPATRHEATVAHEVALLRSGLRYLEHYVVDGCYLVDGRLSLADCCVFPSLHLCRIVAASLGIPELFVDTPRLARYFEAARADPHIKAAYDEIETALAPQAHH